MSWFVEAFVYHTIIIQCRLQIIIIRFEEQIPDSGNSSITRRI